jgi:hypothetical protein
VGDVTQNHRQPLRREVALFDDEGLELGDIVLERGTGSAGKFVAGVTGGRFNHALIWVGGDFIEAMPGGVRCLSNRRVPIFDPGNWLLLRPLPELAGLGESAAFHAREMTFKEYDTAGAVRTVLSPRTAPAPTKNFCSQLVAESYRRAGVDLLPGKRPESITPNMLPKSFLLQRVSIRLMATLNYPAEHYDRSASYRASGMHREGEANRTIYGAGVALLNGVALPPMQPMPGNLSELLALLPHLQPRIAAPVANAILKEMETTGYFDLLTPQLDEMWPRVKASPYWQEQVPGWRQTLRRHEGNAEAIKEILAAQSLPMWQALRNMHLNYATRFEAMIARAIVSRPKVGDRM